VKQGALVGISNSHPWACRIVDRVEVERRDRVERTRVAEVREPLQMLSRGRAPGDVVEGAGALVAVRRGKDVGDRRERRSTSRELPGSARPIGNEHAPPGKPAGSSVSAARRARRETRRRANILRDSGCSAVSGFVRSDEDSSGPSPRSRQAEAVAVALVHPTPWSRAFATKSECLWRADPGDDFRHMPATVRPGTATGLLGRKSARSRACGSLA